MTTVTHDVANHVTPERISVPERLVRLARRYAADGDVRLAQLATWTADVYVLEELLWENGLADAPDPVANLAAVGESVASALEQLASDVGRGATPRAVVEAARRAMVSTFDESVHEVLLEQLPALDHLDGCDPAPGGATSGRDRLGDRTAEELVADLRQAAADCSRVGAVFDAVGETEAAARMAHQADVATFEAHLVAAAIRSGDHGLASVDLRWALARELRPADWESSPHHQHSPFATLRRELIAVVGSAEMETLWRAFGSQSVPR